LAFVVIYMAVAGWDGMRADTVDRDMHNLSGQYTNTLKLKAKMQLLQDRKDLKNAGLDAWKITAELLPEGLTIQSLELKGGKTFTLFGNGPKDADGAITDFNEAMRKFNMGGKPFFAKLDPPLTHVNGANMTWSFSGELARTEENQ